MQDDPDYGYYYEKDENSRVPVCLVCFFKIIAHGSTFE